MKLNDFINKGKREFIIMLCLVGVIPFLVFVYLMTTKVLSIKVSIEEIGLVMILTTVVFILGILSLFQNSTKNKSPQINSYFFYFQGYLIP